MSTLFPLSTRLAPLAALFGFSPAAANGSVMNGEVTGTIDLTQLLLLRGSKTVTNTGTITAINTFTTGLQVPTAKAWAVLGCSAQVNLAAGAQYDNCMAYADQLSNPYQYGPTVVQDINILGTPQFQYLQAPPSPWPILLAPGMRIGVVCAAGAFPAALAFAVTARIVELDLYGS